MLRFHAAANASGSGALSAEEFAAALEGGDADRVLFSTGLSQASGRDVSPEEAMNMVSAALVWNRLDAREGFATFDVDQDGRISLADLRASAEALQLQLTEPQLAALFAHLDRDTDSFVSPAEWDAGLRAACPTGVLHSRGVSLDEVACRGDAVAAPEATPEGGAAAAAAAEEDEAARADAALRIQARQRGIRDRRAVEAKRKRGIHPARAKPSGEDELTPHVWSRPSFQAKSAPRLALGADGIATLLDEPPEHPAYSEAEAEAGPPEQTAAPEAPPPEAAAPEAAPATEAATPPAAEAAAPAQGAAARAVRKAGEMTPDEAAVP